MAEETQTNDGELNLTESDKSFLLNWSEFAKAALPALIQKHPRSEDDRKIAKRAFELGFAMMSRQQIIATGISLENKQGEVNAAYAEKVDIADEAEEDTERTEFPLEN